MEFYRIWSQVWYFGWVLHSSGILGVVEILNPPLPPLCSVLKIYMFFYRHPFFHSRLWVTIFFQGRVDDLGFHLVVHCRFSSKLLLGLVLFLNPSLMFKVLVILLSSVLSFLFVFLYFLGALSSVLDWISIGESGSVVLARSVSYLVRCLAGYFLIWVNMISLRRSMGGLVLLDLNLI